MSGEGSGQTNIPDILQGGPPEETVRTQQAVTLDENTALQPKPLSYLIHTPDIVNGDVVNIVQAAPKASIPSAYKWTHISGMTYAEAERLVEYTIRGVYAHLVVAAGADATDDTKARARKQAIVLGAVRTGAASAYKLDMHTLNQSEMTVSGLRYHNGKIYSENGAATAGSRYPMAVSMPDLTPDEEKLVGTLIFMGFAVPALQGASLVSTGHHFLPSTKNIFMGMKRQVLGTGTEWTKNWVDTMGDQFDDLAFHKACHPISPPVKRGWAKQAIISARLRAAGHGAAAIRLPAIPSEAQVGKAGLGVVDYASATIKQMGHRVNTDIIEGLIRKLEVAPAGQSELDAVKAIERWAVANAASVAFCAGITQFVHESTSTGQHTLLKAYSIKRIMADKAASVQSGLSYARAAADLARKQYETGNVKPIDISV